VGEKRSDFAAAIDAIVADCNDRLEWVRFSNDHLQSSGAGARRTMVELHAP
jgi:hypothetical protein